jgi:hypothetical protein
VWGLECRGGLRVEGSGCKICGAEFQGYDQFRRGSGFGFRVSSLGFRVEGLSIKISGFWFRVQDLRLRVEG